MIRFDRKIEYKTQTLSVANSILILIVNAIMVLGSVNVTILVAGALFALKLPAAGILGGLWTFIVGLSAMSYLNGVLFNLLTVDIDKSKTKKE